jgi:hypothetical protein
MGPALARVVWEYFHPAATLAADGEENASTLELAG